MMILEPGDLPVLTTLFLPTSDREVLWIAAVEANDGIFTYCQIQVKMPFLFQSDLVVRPESIEMRMFYL